jgi:hypothetical protein
VSNSVTRTFHSEGAELRFVKGAFESPGPATVRVRLRVPVLAGETVHVSRLPVGEWVGLEWRTLAEPQGIGISESRLWDEKGPIGRSLQSLLIDRLALD